MLVLGPSFIVMLLFYLVEWANSFPSHFIEPSIALNDFIKHYELAFYNAEDVANQHKRIRRATTSAKANSNQPLKLTIKTSNKIFKLVLRPDEYLFADDVVFEGENGKMVNFDRSKVYVGTLEDDERAKVRGIITKDGLFDGTISTQLEELYVEPISRYKANWNHDTSHTIVYKLSDVTHPDAPFSSCSSNSHTKHKPSDLNTIARRSKRNTDQTPSSSSSWPKFDNFFKQASPGPSKNASSLLTFRSNPLPYDFPSANFGPAEAAAADAVHHHHQHHHHPHHRQNPPPKSTDNVFYDFDLTVPKYPPPEPPVPMPMPLPPRTPDDESFNYEFNDTFVRPSNNRNTWRPKIVGGPIDTVYKYTANISKSSKGYQPSSASIIPHKNNPKILVGSGGGGGGGGAEESRANLIITSDDSSESHARKRAIVDPKKTTCMLYLQADHLFFEKYGTEETCIEVMTRHVQRVNSIYRNTDFNLDGKPDNISFMIKRIKVHSAKDPMYRFPGNYGVEKFLEIFSEEDYDAFCLAYMFTYRDFEMGTLGLAWTGDLKNAGGVCEKNGHYRGSLKSLNTGIVTVLNYGKHVPSAVSHVTLAHEIGHNFGSPHDPDGCTPGGDDGNFIMFARATSGDKKNNNKFSPCSLNAINPVLNVKARSPKGCFTEPQKSICGNGVVEADEECDCGWEEDCKDSCCYPQRRYPPLDEPPCHLNLTANAVCSPSQGPCCTTDCKIKSGDICRSDNGCRDSSYCNGASAQCPPSTNKPNKTVCNEEYVCYMGECTGSICLAYGLESCQCIPTAADPATKACELCCKLPGENQPCLSSFQWNQAPYDVPDMFAKPGTPCNDYNGYCDVFRKCREVDPSGPIATLRKLLLSEENIASFKKWAYDHWYYCGLIFLTFLLFMIISTKVLGKKSKVKSVTVVHSSPTETVRLPDGDGAGGGPAVVVHPIVVRTKLPLKKKVREKRRTAAAGAGAGAGAGANENVPHNVNNNNSPIEAKKKKRDAEAKSNVKAKSKTKLRTRKAAKKETQAGVSGASDANQAVTEDPLGKVRNWLMNSHSMDSLGSLKKSKSSPASFDLSDANGVKKRQKVQTAVTAATAAAPTNVTTVAKPTPANIAKPAAESGKTVAKKPKDTPRVKLQVVYKPPFKFSVKLGKQKNAEISSHLIKDKRPEAVKQRAALLIRADRIRANAAAAPTINEKSKNQSKSKAAVSGVATSADNGDKNAPNGRSGSAGDSGAKPGRAVEYKRSISAPQSAEPVYENTVFENTTSNVVAAGSTNPSHEEPHYVNLGCTEENVKSDPNVRTKHWPSNSNGVAAESFKPTSSVAHPSSSAIKRSCSNDFRSSTSKPSNNASSSKTFTKRRNSYDTKHAPSSRLPGSSEMNEPAVEFVKRQHSDETDVISAAARNEFKRRSAVSIKRTNSVDDSRTGSGVNLTRSHQPRKSTSYRKSYHDRTSSSASPFIDLASKSDTRSKKISQQPPDHNLISFGSPSFDRGTTTAAAPKRKTSHDASAFHDAQLIDPFGSKNSSNRGHITRNTSHSSRRKTDSDKFKRFSLQNTAEAAAISSAFSAVPKTSITDTTASPTSMAESQVNATSAPMPASQFSDSPFHQQQYDIPSDLEVLLSETENPMDI